MTDALEQLLDPRRCAVLTMELQRGVVGDLARIEALARVVGEVGVIGSTARLLAGARAAGVRVVHCTAAFRRDRAGSYLNVPMVRGFLEDPEYLEVGSPDVQLVPELGPEPGDLESQRLHGMSPFTDSALDPMLRSGGITTVVATGVSLNVGIPGLVIEAINRGYSVVVPTDCVAGAPREYGEAVLQHSLSRIAHLTTTPQILTTWP